MYKVFRKTMSTLLVSLSSVFAGGGDVSFYDLQREPDQKLVEYFKRQENLEISLFIETKPPENHVLWDVLFSGSTKDIPLTLEEALFALPKKFTRTLEASSFQEEVKVTLLIARLGDKRKVGKSIKVKAAVLREILEKRKRR